MTKLALIEIDRTIADISRREQRAKAHAQTRVRELGARPGHEHLHDHYMGILYSQEGLYNPDFVPLDTPMSGAAETLAQLQQADYMLLLRTCRPHWMQASTIAWLKQHGIPYNAIQCKDFSSRERYIKNVIWKVEAVRLAAPKHDLLLYIDGDKQSIEAVERIDVANIFTASVLSELQIP